MCAGDIPVLNDQHALGFAPQTVGAVHVVQRLAHQGGVAGQGIADGLVMIARADEFGPLGGVAVGLLHAVAQQPAAPSISLAAPFGTGGFWSVRHIGVFVLPGGGGAGAEAGA